MEEITITQNNFQEEVLASEIPVLVDFWAAWCGPCKMLAPIVGEIAQEYAGKLKIGKVNVDDEPLLASRFHIMTIPTLILFKGGRISKTSVGYQRKDELLQLLSL